ncbi:MAG TPA: cytochrome c family protein [Spirochaetota bacterium]|nr:cytochrome c family protein [Spirochaetota bacterium]HRZ29183.1 cytochrome c family protein [Spirochaetota bacterium]
MGHSVKAALTFATIIACAGILSGGGSHTYIGVETCAGSCHNNDAIGNQYRLWQMSPHARAMRDLVGEKGREIAAASSIKEPDKDPACLQCHTTGGGKNAKTRDESVGCEACHGPGSDYHETSVHVDYIDRESAYMKAIKKGMYPILGIVDSHLKKREKLCLSCHSESRPCYPADSAERIRQKITIQVIDKMVKGDVDLRHPLRR